MWRFFSWMKDNKWRIVRAQPELSNKQLAAMIKGIDPVRVEDLTNDKILCLKKNNSGGWRYILQPHFQRQGNR